MVQFGYHNTMKCVVVSLSYDYRQSSMNFKDCLNVKIACGHHSFMQEDRKFDPSFCVSEFLNL